MIRTPWKRGPVRAHEGPVVVSATKFIYRRWAYMPRVWLNGWRLRRKWGSRPGAVGLYTAAESRRPVTYSLSVWVSEDDLRRFLRGAEHAPLMREFRDRLEATSVVWEMDDFTPERAWREGQERLAQRAPAATRQVA